MAKNEFELLAQSFGVFNVFTLNDVKEFKLLKEENKIFDLIKTSFLTDKLGLNDFVKLEILFNLMLFCLKEKLENKEICAIFAIYWKILEKNFDETTKDAVFEAFKADLMRHSMDEPPRRILIFSKKTMEKVGNYFIDTFYQNFNLFQYLLTSQTELEIRNSVIFETNMPFSVDLSLAKEVLPRKHKILSQYLKNTSHLSEAEKKIEAVLEVERDEIEDFLDREFTKQDQEFSEKVTELKSKKKKR